MRYKLETHIYYDCTCYPQLDIDTTYYANVVDALSRVMVILEALKKHCLENPDTDKFTTFYADITNDKPEDNLVEAMFFSRAMILGIDEKVDTNDKGECK